MKKLIMLLTAAILVLAGCSGGSSEEGDGVITVWAWDPNFNIPVMETAAKYYNEENPDVVIEVVDMSQEDVIQKLHTQLTSGDTTNLPDIVLIEDYNAQMFLESYPGAFYDMSEQVNYDDFAPYKKDAVTSEGKQYGMPFDTGSAGLYYRTDYIENAGYTQEDMQDLTWEEYMAIGEDVVAANPGVSWLGTDVADTGLVRMMLQSTGSWYYSDQGTEVANLQDNTTLVAAMEIWKTIVNSPTTYFQTDWAAGVAAVNGGTVATAPTGCWYTSTIMAAPDQSGKWAVAPMPSLTEESGHATNLGGSSWYILNGTGDEELAMDFLNSTFGSSVAFYEEILINYGAIGTYIPASSSEAYSQPVEFFGGQAIYQDFANWSAEIPSVSYGTNTATVNDAIKGNVPAYFDGTDDVTTTLTKANDIVLNQ